MAVDFGGPRKEFFQFVLAAIKEKYFDNGLREHLIEDYLTIGKLLGKCFILQCLENIGAIFK
ncbi:hypothetical protein DPMN_133553 [Dreissena polymorpha]|uniref:HECT domain-containing protein n=1 Tax=Dreissena polymorpha TaxID=45954 RepID=A0A9D4FY45_DREPO|nr:hypothetical protein DPMN_133553 [Dreissena polymorpha]